MKLFIPHDQESEIFIEYTCSWSGEFNFDFDITFNKIIFHVLYSLYRYHCYAHKHLIYLTNIMITAVK